MLKWSVSSASDKRPVVTRKGEHNADVYSYNGSLALPGDIEREHTEDFVQTTDPTTDMSHSSNKAEPEFRPRNYLGSDPRAATCRGKLQSKRSKLNVEINKAMMLRSGAENLHKASTDAKTKENVSLELRFVNSSLQLLKEQLAELNSSVEIYQNREEVVMPMIPLGLKETKELELRDSIKRFIEDHYHEDGEEYEDSLAELMDLRQAMRTPTRDSHGISLLFQYYNHLHFVERRFFSQGINICRLHFEWYDSLTGVPYIQTTVAFEKASVLFNIGSLYTQIGARYDRTTEDGLDSAVDNFLRAAGTFEFIKENFSHAPSSDLGTDCLRMLVQLMLGQARECLFEKSVLGLDDGNDLDHCLELSQEAAHVSDTYDEVLRTAVDTLVKDCMPCSWLCLLQVKREHYRALADYYVATGLANHQGELAERSVETLQFLHDVQEGNGAELPVLPKTVEQRKRLGKAHLREALLMHEEALRVNRMCPEMRKKDNLQEVLKHFHERSLAMYEDMDEEDDFHELIEPPPIFPSTKFQLSLSYPAFSAHPVSDLFHSLGPEAVFSAKHNWTPPRTVQLTKKEDEGYGLSVRGSAPVVVAGVERGSLAEIAGIREGDYLVGIGERDVKWDTHEQVVAKIRDAVSYLQVTVVTPIKAWVKNRSSESEMVSSSIPSSTSNFIKVFVPSSSRTSFSSNSSLESYSSHISDLSWRERKKRSWAVLKIKKHL